MDQAIIFMQPLFTYFGSSVKLFLLCMVIFIPLAWLFPSNPKQPYFSRSTVTDIAYWFSGPVIYTPIAISITILLLHFLYSPEQANLLHNKGLSPINSWPIWVQALVMLLVTDFLQYWAHRLFHHHPLWKFHAIHHAPVTLDWLTSVRFHPVNIVLYSTCINAVVYMAGFSPETFAILLPFNSIYSPLVHANLNWTYGPFRYVLASPVFHRWHHTLLDEGGNKNFAPTFPFLDVMFGTFYMPKGVQPVNFGAPHDAVPDHFIGQLIYPFRESTPK